jgi:PD-(D/E)XK endonuclease
MDEKLRGQRQSTRATLAGRTGASAPTQKRTGHPIESETELSPSARMPGKRRVIQNCKRRGEWAELVFMARAAEMGLETLRVSGDSAKYDVAVEAGGRFWRVQVKSTMCRCGRRSYACAAHPNQGTRPYRRREFDFLAAYVIPEDVWYIIPARLVVHGRMSGIILSPSLPGHKWEPYMEAWELLKTGSRRPALGFRKS